MESDIEHRKRINPEPSEVCSLYPQWKIRLEEKKRIASSALCGTMCPLKIHTHSQNPKN